MSDALSWYIVLQVAAVAVWPLVARALAPLDDRGWAASKAGGILGIAWLTWLVCMLAPVPFTRLTLFIAMLLLGALAWGWHARTGLLDELRAFVLARRAVLLAWEAVFLVGFVLFAVLRSHNPAVAATEKPMD